ncbi:unnamed protein product, partial [Symbiodinium sp. CCMP2592]
AEERVSQWLAGPGEMEYHLITESTHAAFNARLQQGDGHGLLVGPERSAFLCPEYAKSGKFTKDSHIVLTRLLEAAHGGRYDWDTQADVLARPGKARKTAGHEERVDCGVHFETTNIGMVLLQQPSVLSTWWAPSEARHKIGLANRCVFSAGRRGSQLSYPAGLRDKFVEFRAEIFQRVIVHVGHKVPLHGDELVWKLDAVGQAALLEARGAMHEASQDAYYADGGTLNSMFEKLSYFWTHEGLLTTICQEAIASIVERRPFTSGPREIPASASKLALEWTHRRLARGFNMLDVDISRASWRAREGAGVRRSVGPFKAAASHAQDVAVKLRATPGPVIYADVAGRNVPVFRNVYSCDAVKREDAYQKLVATGQYLERHDLGVFEHTPRRVACLRQASVGKHVESGSEYSASVANPATILPWLPGGVRHGRGNEGHREPALADKPDAKADAGRGIYQEANRGALEDEEIPRTIPEATRVARRLCLKTKPACSVSFTTKRLVNEAGQSVYKWWGACAECKPKCTFSARVTICIDGPGEGKFTVSHRGEHAKKKLAQGGRLLSAELQNVVSEMTEAKVPITTKNLRESVERANLDLACEPEQVHSLVRRLRQKNKQTSHVAKVPIQIFLDEVKAWEADLPQDLDKEEDLSRLIILKSPHGSVVEDSRVYVPLSCPGMLQRLRDAAKHRIRLIVDMKMDAVANNYGMITLCFATSSARLRNTTAAMLKGRRQTYLAHTCTAQPIMQAIVHTEREDNVTACFEDLCWLCQEVAGFDLKAQILHVHADYAPGIAAAQRNVFPGVRLIGDYFYYKKALFKTLPSKFQKAQQGSAKPKGRKKRDPNVAAVSHLSDLTRCLPSVQLADAVWQVIFENLPTQAATYLQKEYFDQASVADLQHIFKTVQAPACGATKLWLPSFWTGAAWLLGSRAQESHKDGLVSALAGLQHLYKKWQKIFDCGKKIKMTHAPSEESDYLLNSGSLRTQGRSPA